MELNDLKTGMIVKFRAGYIGLIIGNTAITAKHGGKGFDSFNNDLTRKNYSENDIIEVYSEPKSRNLNGALSAPMNYWLESKNFIREEYSTLLWKEKATEMTLKEVSEKLGIRNLKIIEG